MNNLDGVLATLAAESPPTSSLWRHKDGRAYQVVCVATDEYGVRVVVYREGWSYHTLPLPQFTDGRFTRVETQK